MAASSFTQPYILTETGMKQIEDALRQPSPLDSRILPDVHVSSPKEIMDAVRARKSGSGE